MDFIQVLFKKTCIIRVSL